MKIVLTGGPSSGKTTLIKELEARGCKVLHEFARQVMTEMKLEKKINKSNAVIFQREVHSRQIAAERELDKTESNTTNELVFLDRGYADGRAYCRHFLGYVPEEFMKADVRRYDIVFVLDMLPFVDDGVRREDHAEALRVHDLIVKAYEEDGYKVICVPAFSVEERVKFILDKVSSGRT